MRYGLGILILFLTNSARAYDFSPRSAPQQSKAATRWSLAQWMEQRDKLRWMDLWLNSNTQSPSFYEMYLGGDYAQYQSTTTPNGGAASTTNHLSSFRAHGGAFVSLFGIYGQYEKSAKEDREQWDALGMLRVLGHSDQGSNLTGFYGLHQMIYQGERVRQQQAGGYLTLYLFSFWALQGKYQQYFKADSNLGNQIEGHRLELSSWVEWGALRIYGTYYKEPLKYTSVADTHSISRDGFNLGLRVYLDFKK